MTLQPKISSYGTWKSPITAEKIAAGTNSIINLLVEGDFTYWCEMRPANKGRYTIVRRDSSGQKQDMTPPDFNVRSLVHEYGGGAFTVSKGILYASNAADSKIYLIKPDQAPVPLTQGQIKVEFHGEKQPKGTRFADLHVISQGIIAVGELHQPGEAVENFLALIDSQTGHYQKIASGYDFYSSPAISPDEKKIAWICWNQPEMPWSHTELWVADFSNGKLLNPQCIAGDSENRFNNLSGQRMEPSILSQTGTKDGGIYIATQRAKSEIFVPWLQKSANPMDF